MTTNESRLTNFFFSSHKQKLFVGFFFSSHKVRRASPLTLGGNGGAGEDGGGGGGLWPRAGGRPWFSMAMASRRPTLSSPPPGPPDEAGGHVTEADEARPKLKGREGKEKEEEERSFLTGPF